MVKINHLDENLNIEGKRVLLRVDFNVPMNNGAITENSRIKKVLPTIKFLIEKKAKIIIMQMKMMSLVFHLQQWKKKLNLK